MAQNSVPNDPVMLLDEKAEGNKFLGKKIYDLSEGEMSLYEINDFVDETSSLFKIELAYIGLPSTDDRPLRSKYEGPMSKLLKFILYQSCMNPTLFSKSPYLSSLSSCNRLIYKHAVEASLFTLVRISYEWWTRTSRTFQNCQGPEANEFNPRNFILDRSSNVYTIFHGHLIPQFYVICLDLKSLDGSSSNYLEIHLTKRFKLLTLKELASRTIYKAMEDHVTKKKENAQNSMLYATVMSLDDKSEENKFLGKKMPGYFGRKSIYYIKDFIDDTSKHFKIRLTNFGLQSSADRPLRSKYEGTLSILLKHILFVSYLFPRSSCFDYWPENIKEERMAAYIFRLVKIAFQWWTRVPISSQMSLGPEANEFEQRNFKIDLTRSKVSTVFEEGTTIVRYHVIFLFFESFDGMAEYTLRIKLTKKKEDVDFLSTRDIIVDENLNNLVFPKCLKDCIQRSYYD